MATVWVHRSSASYESYSVFTRTYPRFSPVLGDARAQIRIDIRPAPLTRIRTSRGVLGTDLESTPVARLDFPVGWKSRGGVRCDIATRPSALAHRVVSLPKRSGDPARFIRQIVPISKRRQEELVSDPHGTGSTEEQILRAELTSILPTSHSSTIRRCTIPRLGCALL